MVAARPGAGMSSPWIRVTNGAREPSPTIRALSRSSTAGTSWSSLARMRSACLVRPVTAAASGPLPQTSPMVNRQRPPGNLEHVVEVAANLVPLARCLVRCRQVHARDVRQLGWQQAALQGTGGLQLLRVEPGVVQGKRRTPGSDPPPDPGHLSPLPRRAVGRSRRLRGCGRGHAAESTRPDRRPARRSWLCAAPASPRQVTTAARRRREGSGAADCGSTKW